jgi:hypothetical protein
VLPPYAIQLLGDRIAERLGQNREATLPALALTDVKTTSRQVLVLHPQRQALHQPESRTIQERRDQSMRLRDRGQ